MMVGERHSFLGRVIGKATQRQRQQQIPHSTSLRAGSSGMTTRKQRQRQESKSEGGAMLNERRSTMSDRFGRWVGALGVALVAIGAWSVGVAQQAKVAADGGK